MCRWWQENVSRLCPLLPPARREVFHDLDVLEFLARSRPGTLCPCRHRANPFLKRSRRCLSEHTVYFRMIGIRMRNFFPRFKMFDVWCDVEFFAYRLREIIHRKHVIGTD